MADRRARAARCSPGCWLFLGSLVACAAVSGAQVQAGRSQLSGFVLDDNTGKALPRVLVTLSTTAAQPLETVAYTDARGSFAFSYVPPGRYILSAVLEGYLPGRYGAASPDAAPEILVIKADEVRSSLRMRLRQYGAISGTVLDTDGDPVADAQVELLMAGFRRRKPTFMPVMSVTTDWHGEYRMYRVRPGKYIVAARSFQPVRQVHAEGIPETQAQTAPMFGMQLYPNAERLPGAGALTIPPGKQVNGIDFRLPLRRTVRVRGKVEARENGFAQVELICDDLPESLRQSFGAATVGPDFRFEIANVIPGSYTAVATMNVQGRLYRGLQHVEVTAEADEQQLSITLESGMELSGSVRVEGDGEGPSPTRVVLVSGDAIPEVSPPPQSSIKPDGTFRIQGVLPGIWDIGVEPIPPGGYIKSMMLGDQDVLTEDMVISPGTSAPLKIVVHRRGGVVEGTVLPADGGPQPAKTVAKQPVRAIVVLAPEGRFEHVLSFYSTIWADELGHFELKGITPGAYRL